MYKTEIRYDNDIRIGFIDPLELFVFLQVKTLLFMEMGPKLGLSNMLMILLKEWFA